jgi:DNA-binding LacI/PurR family transcriptional regulator
MLKKVTLKDIALDSGLSISTVSRILSGSVAINNDKARKVFESAHKLNYPLTTQVRPIEFRSSINIALVVRHYTGEFFASLFEGFDQATNDSKLRVNLVSVSHASSTPDQLAAYLGQSQFDAAIIFLPDYKPADYQSIMDCLPTDFPIVSIAPIANPVMDTVTFDNYRGGYLIANHFEELGHKKLGIIQGPVNKSEAMLRKNGFLDYINQSENLSLVWEFNGDYSFEQGKEAFNHFAKSDDKPDAIFCSNDSTTIGFVHSAIREGMHIPDDLALAGYDDLPICNLYTPTITSVHTPYELLGKKTLELIFDRLQEKKGTHHTGYTSLVPVKLSVRESTTALTEAFRNYYK